MKNMYPKAKGKVHPSPPFQQTGSLPPSSDAYSVLKVLPAAILALTTALVMEDREVLAYMVAHSLNATLVLEDRRRCRRSHQQQRPAFDCGCFDCYTSFWIRWDASPNRELIHEVIDAFEEHLATAEGTESARKRARGKRLRNRPFWTSPVISEPTPSASDVAMPTPKCEEVSISPEPLPLPLPEEEEDAPPEELRVLDEKEGGGGGGGGGGGVFVVDGKLEEENRSADSLKFPVPLQSRSLVSKLVPDVMGFFTSRLWTV